MTIILAGVSSGRLTLKEGFDMPFVLKEKTCSLHAGRRLNKNGICEKCEDEKDDCFVLVQGTIISDDEAQVLRAYFAPSD